MKDKIKTNLKNRIDSIEDTDQLYQMYNQLGLDFNVDDFVADLVWAGIKSPDTITNLQDDQQRHLLEADHVQNYTNDTRGVKLFFDGEWYINRNFNLKLRPEWIEIIEE